MAVENTTPVRDVVSIDAVSRGLDQVHAALNMLTHNFGGDSNADEPAKTPGLFGLIQYVSRALCEVRGKLMDIGSDQKPVGDADVLIIEASGMAEVVEHLIGGVEIRFSDFWMCSYFDAINDCVERAIKSFNIANGIQATSVA